MPADYDELRLLCDLVKERDAAWQSYLRTPTQALQLNYRRMQEYRESGLALVSAALNWQPELKRRFKEEARKGGMAVLQRDSAGADAASKRGGDVLEESTDKAVAFCKVPPI